MLDANPEYATHEEIHHAYIAEETLYLVAFVVAEIEWDEETVKVHNIQIAEPISMN